VGEGEEAREKIEEEKNKIGEERMRIRGEEDSH
jgi:hypothetical protein